MQFNDGCNIALTQVHDEDICVELQKAYCIERHDHAEMLFISCWGVSGRHVVWKGTCSSMSLRKSLEVDNSSKHHRIYFLRRACICRG